jgi:hypothetical protein
MEKAVGFAQIQQRSDRKQYLQPDTQADVLFPDIGA